MSIYEIFNIILSLFTLIFLAVYVWKTWAIAKSSKESVEQTKRLIDEETAPYVIVFFDMHNSIVFLVIRNTGKSIAKNIKIGIEPDISNLLSDKTSKEYCKILFSEGIKMLVPEQEIRTFVNMSFDIYNKKDIPMEYNIRALYEGGIPNKKREYESSINFLLYKELPRIQEPTIKDYLKGLEEIKKAIEKLKK
jgi:hypothetical protein